MNDNIKLFLSAGIDVSSEGLDIFLMNEEEKGTHKKFNNTKDGILKLIDWLKNNSFNGKIVMESTGRYSELVAVMLYMEKFNVFLINPLRMKKYQQAGIQKVKTDKHDAKILAEMGIKEKTLDVFKCTYKDMAIKKKIALSRSLEEQLQSLNAMMKNYESSQEILDIQLSITEENIKKIIKDLVKQKEKLQAEVIKEVFPEDDIEAQKDKEVLISINGVSEYYASILKFLYTLNDGQNSDSWVAYTGIAISVMQSGKWQGTGRLSKRSNPYLRKRNFQAAKGAVMNYDSFKTYYEYLRNVKKRSYVESINIIGRKIIRISYSCLKNGIKFDPKIIKDEINDRDYIGKINLSKQEK